MCHLSSWTLVVTNQNHKDKRQYLYHYLTKLSQLSQEISGNTAKATRRNIVASSLHFKRSALVFHMSVLLSGLVNLHLTSRWSVSVRVLSGPFPSQLVTSVRNSEESPTDPTCLN